MRDRQPDPNPSAVVAALQDGGEAAVKTQVHLVPEGGEDLRAQLESASEAEAAWILATHLIRARATGAAEVRIRVPITAAVGWALRVVQRGFGGPFVLSGDIPVPVELSGTAVRPWRELAATARVARDNEVTGRPTDASADRAEEDGPAAETVKRLRLLAAAVTQDDEGGGTSGSSRPDQADPLMDAGAIWVLIEKGARPLDAIRALGWSDARWSAALGQLTTDLAADSSRELPQAWHDHLAHRKTEAVAAAAPVRAATPAASLASHQAAMGAPVANVLAEWTSIGTARPGRAATAARPPAGAPPRGDTRAKTNPQPSAPRGAGFNPNPTSYQEQNDEDDDEL